MQRILCCSSCTCALCNLKNPCGPRFSILTLFAHKSRYFAWCIETYGPCSHHQGDNLHCSAYSRGRTRQFHQQSRLDVCSETEILLDVSCICHIEQLESCNLWVRTCMEDYLNSALRTYMYQYIYSSGAHISSWAYLHITKNNYTHR